MSMGSKTTTSPLRNQLHACLESLWPLNDEVERQADCIRELDTLAQTLGTGWRVKAFGSAANGFLTRGSDLDVTCYNETSIDKTNDSFFANKVLQTQLLPLLQQHDRFKVIKEIWSARVPIIKLLFDDILEVDLSGQNLDALRNSQLLLSYSKLNPKIRNLVLAVKFWAKAENVHGALNQHLSSYSFTLMVLYFLQVHPALSMPCLPVHFFDVNGSLVNLPSEWICVPTLDMLLTSFFNFYAGFDTTGFHWGSEVVSIRTGQRLHWNETEFDQLNERDNPRLHIEDPFLRHRNLNCVLSYTNESNLRIQIQQTAMLLLSSRVPMAFFTVKTLATDSLALHHHVQTTQFAEVAPSSAFSIASTRDTTRADETSDAALKDRLAKFVKAANFTSATRRQTSQESSHESPALDTQSPIRTKKSANKIPKEFQASFS